MGDYKRYTEEDVQKWKESLLHSQVDIDKVNLVELKEAAIKARKEFETLCSQSIKDYYNLESSLQESLETSLDEKAAELQKVFEDFASQKREANIQKLKDFVAEQTKVLTAAEEKSKTATDKYLAAKNNR